MFTTIAACSFVILIFGPVALDIREDRRHSKAEQEFNNEQTNRAIRAAQFVRQQKLPMGRPEEAKGLFTLTERF